MEALAEEHRVLQQAYQAEHRRAEDLQHRVDDIVQFEGVHAPRIRSWVQRLVREHEVDQLTIAEYRDALAERDDNSLEVEESLSRIKYWKASTMRPLRASRARSRHWRPS